MLRIKRLMGIHARLSVCYSVAHTFLMVLYTDYLILKKYYENSNLTSQMKKVKYLVKDMVTERQWQPLTTWLWHSYSPVTWLQMKESYHRRFLPTSRPYFHTLSKIKRNAVELLAWHTHHCIYCTLENRKFVGRVKNPILSHSVTKGQGMNWGLLTSGHMPFSHITSVKTHPGQVLGYIKVRWRKSKYVIVTPLLDVQSSKLCGIITSPRWNNVGSIHGGMATDSSQRWVKGAFSISRAGCKGQFDWDLSQPGQGGLAKLSSCSFQTCLQWTGSLLDAGWQVQDMSWRNSGLISQETDSAHYRACSSLLIYCPGRLLFSERAEGGRIRNRFLSQDFLLQMFAAGTCSAFFPLWVHGNNLCNHVSVFITSLLLN